MVFDNEKESIARRRAISNALMERSFQPYQNQTAGGYVIPYGLGDALSSFGPAVIANYRNKRLDEEEKAIAEKEEAGLAEATRKIMEAALGREQQGGPLQYPKGAEYQQFEPEVKPDLNQAALMTVTDPYLKDNKGAQRVIEAMLKGKNSANSLGVQFLPTEEGYKVGNRATGEITAPPGGPLLRDSASPELMADKARQIEQSKKDVALNMNPKIDKAEKLAVNEAMTQIEKPQWESKIRAAKDRKEMLDLKIAQIKDDASWMSTGLMNQLTGWISGTPAKDMDLDLDTLKAIAGFTELRDLKDAGGTLGQVSNQENILLQSVWNNVEASQSKEQFLRNLDIFRAQVEKSWTRINAAYEDKYGKPEGAAEKPPVDTNNLINLSPEEVQKRADEILRRNR